MSTNPPLYVVFTMNCDNVASKFTPSGPKTWRTSGRSIEGYCSRVLSAGMAVTLFVAAECAEEHDPLLEEMAERGAELGLLVEPEGMGDGRYKRCLGSYKPDDQREVIRWAADRFRRALGIRPRSFRSGRFSASDETFGVLHDLGFTQGSVSAPGRQIVRHQALWDGAVTEPHYTHASDRLQAGDLPFLEVPITTDPYQKHPNGMSFDLTVETGSVEEWHQPLIEARLEQMEKEQVMFRTLCILAHNHVDYYDPEEKHTRTLEDLLAYIGSLRSRYEVIPLTIAGVHAQFRSVHAP